eukprot:1605050-Heterocapsa_arctica.AAC.1
MKDKRKDSTQDTTPSRVHTNKKSKLNSDSIVDTSSPNRTGTLNALFTLQRANRAEGFDPHARDYQESSG